MDSTDLRHTVDFLSTISDLSDGQQSDVPRGMFSSSDSISTVVDAFTRASVPSGAGQFSFEHGLLSSTPLQDEIDDRVCSCFKCRLELRPYVPGLRTFYQRYETEKTCFFKCDYKSLYPFEIWNHYVKVHLKQEERYCCPEPKCTRTFKRTAELKRHLQIHCLVPGGYPCDEHGCKYGGTNGFGRRDKLLSHKRNVHEGKATPGQPMRRCELLPKA